MFPDDTKMVSQVALSAATSQEVSLRNVHNNIENEIKEIYSKPCYNCNDRVQHLKEFDLEIAEVVEKNRSYYYNRCFASPTIYNSDMPDMEELELSLSFTEELHKLINAGDELLKYQQRASEDDALAVQPTVTVQKHHLMNTDSSMANWTDEISSRPPCNINDRLQHINKEINSEIALSEVVERNRSYYYKKCFASPTIYNNDIPDMEELELSLTFTEKLYKLMKVGDQLLESQQRVSEDGARSSR
ncbi:uncharacterized protein LOC112590619 [Harpegnathos saltator]|uniref:uncharacterized protein LOC105190980 n=1 Tax=Harpegnathos saltator TaxID=610380 RepID=UPI000DBEE298|nr:uncharacterized protein LOC105190980 [Harpegnathos saltator]XP_025163496.1 uncharacterized protein LOC112590618 [Harpegnathos saltator]XP_025163497.1 uncharacterized protein LOC112590619 [Harpegnathos saltator]